MIKKKIYDRHDFTPSSLHPVHFFLLLSYSLLFSLPFDVPPLYATRRCSQTSPLWISNHLVHMTLEIAEREGVGVGGATEARELSLGH